MTKAKRSSTDYDGSWQVRDTCFLCGTDYVVNNYDDRKVRRKKHRIMGKNICPWCSTRLDVPSILLSFETVERALDMECLGSDTEDECQCAVCFAHAAFGEDSNES